MAVKMSDATHEWLVHDIVLACAKSGIRALRCCCARLCWIKLIFLCPLSLNPISQCGPNSQFQNTRADRKNEYWLFPLLLASSLPCCRRIFAAHRHHHYASLWTTYGELSWIYPVKTRSTSDLIVMAQWANTLMDHDFYPHIAWGYVSLRIFLYDAYFQPAGMENVHPLSKKSSLSKRLLQSNDMAF